MMQNVSFVLWLLGRRDKALGLRREVVQRREKLVEKLPKEVLCRVQLAEGWYTLDTALFDVGRRDEADKAFQQARDVHARLAAEDPNNAAYHEALILMHLALRDHAAAAKAVDELVRLAPGDENLYAKGSVFLTWCARLAARDESLSPTQRQDAGQRYHQQAL
jgi:tetratricopeptide (TPR) repeat protein